MDPQLQTLGVQLTEAAVRNTAGAIADRIGAAKARRRNEETIAELEEIVSGLLSDKSELVRIAQAFEEELVAQRISATDVEYISTNFVPLVGRLIEAGAGGSDPDEAQQLLELIQPLLSVETVTVLQLIGFNFKKAIGEPLTELVSRLILAQAPPDPALAAELQRGNLELQTQVLEMASDPDAYQRFLDLQSRDS